MTDEPQGRQSEREGGETTVHRGISWYRDPAGGLAWLNEDQGRWVRWRSGSDAPPRPPEWEKAQVAPLSSGRRPKWRSGYRLFPVALIVFIVVVGVVQALGSGSSNQVKDEAKAAHKLLGQCLAQNGTVDGHPRYEVKAVACSASQASVKVVDVLPGTPGAAPCPEQTTPVQLAYPGVAYPHVECVQPVRKGN